MTKSNQFIKSILLFTLISTFPFCITQGQNVCDTTFIQYDLGEVVINATKLTKMQSIDAQTIEMYEKEAISDALNIIPGVINVAGAKSDMVYVRGFNQRQVPIYFDGIPISLAYDGYLDLDMFMNAEITKISVATGTNSLLYGPNALGGAINIVTQKPKAGLSAKAKVGTFTNGNYTALTAISFAADKYYFKASYAQLDKEDYRLSDDYEATSSVEDGGSYANTYKKTDQLSLKVALTPREGHEYALSYVKHDGEKGIPTYLGNDGSVRYWQFPAYDTQNIYFLSNSQFNRHILLKTRFYYDKFDDHLMSYDDSTFTTQNYGYSFSSFYDDYSFGGSTTLSYLNKKNKVIFDAQYKYNDHQEYDEGEEPIQMTDRYTTLSLMDCYYLNKLTLHAGVSLLNQHGIHAQYYNDDDVIDEFETTNTTAYNGELNATYTFSERSTINIGIAYKTRFPTMKDRYSSHLGTSIVNPDLKEESAINYTLDYTNAFFDNKISLAAGLYYSDLNDAIISIYGVDEDDSSIYQYQNTGKAEYIGGDIALRYHISTPLTLQANYAYIKRNNLSSPSEKYTGVPKNSFQAALIYSFKNNSYININAESYSNRYSSSDGTTVDGFTLLNAKGSCYIYKDMVSIEMGIANMLDKDYQISEGYPMMGRNGFVTVVFKL